MWYSKWWIGKFLFQQKMGNKSPLYFLKIIHKMYLRVRNKGSLDTELTCWAAEYLCERKQSRYFDEVSLVCHGSSISSVTTGPLENPSLVIVLLIFLLHLSVRSAHEFLTEPVALRNPRKGLLFSANPRTHDELRLEQHAHSLLIFVMINTLRSRLFLKLIYKLQFER